MKDKVLPFLGFNSFSSDFEFIGSAFLMQPNILITAGHNIEREENKIYKSFGTIYNGETLHLSDLIFKEYENKLITIGEKKDLAIFRLNINNDSLGAFYPHELKKDEKVEIRGYKDYSSKEIDPEVHYSRVTYADFSYQNFPDEYGKAKYSKYTNCFGVDIKTEPGFSGCPIIKDNLIAGMLIYGFWREIVGARKPKELETTAIKSTYISRILTDLMTK